MSDTEIKTIYDEMITMFGTLPNHKQEPIQFTHYVKLYQYYKAREEV
jgi:hypothetical protein